MGVLACDRGDCSNIMCNRLSHEYGYICDECFEELVQRGILTDIKAFMSSDKPLTNYDYGSYQYFNTLFPNRNER